MNDAATPSAYRVLARKYRPSTFADLIGQEAMVRTVSNAFEAGRIPQAWVLTGVRGVGKTTTARILARALNYELPDGSVTGPTITMPGLGIHCQAIMESRHLDVIEMDAASHNGVDDVRQINDAIRYAPVSARYKVYILDEVHMLSSAAFNALLKTLEEPPTHAKFVFATTEIRKVPITVLSRCQRFDLRRVDAALLVQHLQGIAAKEEITADPEALALIARAAEGSVRDALSLFDQAIAHAAGPVRAEDVRQMLGLADRSRIIDLFEALMRADLSRALQELRDQYDTGADPAMVLGDLAEFTHFITRVKVVPALADDVSLTEAERTRGRAFAAKLSMRVLARTWQMLLKGLEEVAASGRPLAAAEMILVRIAYAADLPTPDEAIRSLGESARGNGATRTPAGQASPRTEMPVRSEAPPRADLAPRGPRAGRARPPLRPNCRRPRPSLPVPRSTRRRARLRASKTWSRSPRRSATSPSRARSNAMYGWCAAKTAGWRSRSKRARRKRSPASSRRNSAIGRAGAGWSSSPPSRACPASRRRRRPAEPNSKTACAQIRWCRRCSRGSPARRSSMCARPRARRPRWTTSRSSRLPRPAAPTTNHKQDLQCLIFSA